MPTDTLITRRRFVLSTFSALALELQAHQDETPLIRIGAMSDDHLRPNKEESHRRVNTCFNFLRSKGVDIVIDTGDIADLSHVSELSYFRDCFDKAFTGTNCTPFFCIANHDYNYIPNTPKNNIKTIENASRALGMDGPNLYAVVKGFIFVNVFQNEPDPKALHRAIEKAVAENIENRPIFVVNHIPPFGTTTGTEHWSSREIRNVLNAYPQVIALSGHIHTSITCPSNIWQGEFTAINLGANHVYTNKIRGEVTILKVFRNHIDIRRYEAESGREIGSDDRWSIPLPLTPQSGPYRPELRKHSCPQPIMSTDTPIAFRQVFGNSYGYLTFSPAQPHGSARRYRIKLESQLPDKTWKFLCEHRWSAPQVLDEPESWSCPLESALLDSGRPHRVTITPVSSFDVEGVSQTSTFLAPTTPMTELPTKASSISRYQRTKIPHKCEFKPDADGWFQHKSGVTAIVLSKELSFAAQNKKSLTLLFDIASKQSSVPNTFSIAKFTASDKNLIFGVGDRIYTLSGKCESHRYAWTINPDKNIAPEDELSLVIREGDAGAFRINSVKSYVL